MEKNTIPEERTAVSNGVLQLVASSCGAELVSVRYMGEERLWQNGDGGWAGHAPVLFPVCGNCAVRVDGKDYPIGRHGFARKSVFTPIKKRENCLVYELRSDAATRAVYPFDFIFRVGYFLRGAALRIVYEAENPSDAPLLFSCGGHESYLLSRPLGEYELRFPREEKFLALLHDGEGKLTGETRAFGRGTVLPLPETFLTGGNTLILHGLRSRRLSLCEREGREIAKLSFYGFPELLLWRTGEARMICIEPWRNLPDGGERAEFGEKRGIISLPPHKKRRFVHEIVYK